MADNMTEGIVKSLRKDRKGIQLEDGSWYSQFTEVSCGRGDRVRVEYKINGHFKNISKLEVLEKAQAETTETRTSEKALTMLVSYAKDQVTAQMNFASATNTLVDIKEAWKLAREQVWEAYEDFKEKLNA